ncbi:hypothetical protein [Brucella intermedia]|nr:hypothetical protein [Brucella intermedia]
MLDIPGATNARPSSQTCSAALEVNESNHWLGQWLAVLAWSALTPV